MTLLLLRDLYSRMRRGATLSSAEPRFDVFVPWRPAAVFSGRRARLEVALGWVLASVLASFAAISVVALFRGWTVASEPGPQFAPALLALQLTVWLLIPLAISIYLHTQRTDFIHHRSQPGRLSFVPAMLAGHAGITRRRLPATRLTARIEYTTLQLALAYFWAGTLLDLAWHLV